MTAGEVRLGLDTGRLESCLADAIEGIRPPLTVRQFSGGRDSGRGFQSEDAIFPLMKVRTGMRSR